MTQTSRIRATALLLALTCLLWSGYMMIPISNHLLKHGQPSKHATQHSSLACAWMCLASTFIQTGKQNLNQSFIPVFYIPVLFSTLLLLNLPHSALTIRAPPFLTGFKAFSQIR